MKHAVTLLLDLDTFNWLETVQKNLQRQRNAPVTVSETVDYVCRSHFIKTARRYTDQQHADKVGDKLRGSKPVGPPTKKLLIT
jgi:hypothetical protein